MQVSVIGCGHWGKNLVRNFHELGALSSISDPNIELAKQMSSKYKVPSLKLDEVMLSDCTGVVIAAPAHHHASIAQKAFLAGKHVYVEKPLAMTLADADKIIEAADKNNCHLMVGHLLQYHPVFIHLKKMVELGYFGKLLHLYSNRLSYGKVRSEEDVVWSFAPHDVSMLLSLVKDKVDSVQCHGVIALQNNIADSAFLDINFSKGLKASISCSWLNPVKEQKLVVIGDKSMAIFDDTQPWENKLAVYDHEVDFTKTPPHITKSDVSYIKIDQGEPLREECKYFLDIMAGKVSPRTDGIEGRSVLEVMTAASKSMKTGELVYA